MEPDCADLGFQTKFIIAKHWKVLSKNITKSFYVQQYIDGVSRNDEWSCFDCRYRELLTVLRIFQVSSKLRQEKQKNQIGGKVT